MFSWNRYLHVVALCVALHHTPIEFHVVLTSVSMNSLSILLFIRCVFHSCSHRQRRWRWVRQRRLSPQRRAVCFSIQSRATTSFRLSATKRARLRVIGSHNCLPSYSPNTLTMPLILHQARNKTLISNFSFFMVFVTSTLQRVGGQKSIFEIRILPSDSVATALYVRKSNDCKLIESIDSAFYRRITLRRVSNRQTERLQTSEAEAACRERAR
jgi:hypothetical protein